jgi:hypothetical protein
MVKPASPFITIIISTILLLLMIAIFGYLSHNLVPLHLNNIITPCADLTCQRKLLTSCRLPLARLLFPNLLDMALCGITLILPGCKCQFKGNRGKICCDSAKRFRKLSTSLSNGTVLMALFLG